MLEDGVEVEETSSTQTYSDLMTRHPVSESLLQVTARDLSLIVKQQSELDGDERNRWSRDCFNAVLSTAYLTKIPPSHRVVACNVLCGLCKTFYPSATCDGPTQLLSCEDAIRELLRLYISRYDLAKASVMKQILHTITKLTFQLTSENAIRAMRIWVISELLRMLLIERDPVKSKVAFIALTIFLSKSFVCTQDIVACASQIISFDEPEHPHETKTVQEATGSFLFIIMGYLNLANTAPAAGQFLAILIKRLRSEGSSEASDTPLWSTPLIRRIREGSTTMETTVKNLFSDLFKDSSADYWSFLTDLELHCFPPSNKGSDSILQLYFVALQVGKEIGLVRESDHGPLVDRRNSATLVSHELLDWAMDDFSPWIRLSSLSLITSSSHMTRPMSSQTLTSLRIHVPHMFADTDTRVRAEFYSLIQSLLHRIRAISAALARCTQNVCQTVTVSDSSTVSFDPPSEDLNQHEAFIQWLHNFASNELHPCASYQRHISGLLVIQMLLRSGVDASIDHDHLHKQAKRDISWPFNLNVITSLQIRLLFDLLMDPFEDVRHTAMTILQLRFGSDAGRLDFWLQQPLHIDTTDASSYTPKARLDNVSYDVLACIVNRSQARMLQTGRIDYGDGFARIFSLSSDFQRRLAVKHGEVLTHSSYDSPVFDSINNLLDSLEQSLDIAEREIEVAVDGHPLHGFLIALRYVIMQNSKHLHSIVSSAEASTEFLTRAVTLNWRVWRCLRSLLCNDAPEGFLPNEVHDEEDMDTKSLLSYAWRAVKEASLLSTELARLFPLASTVDTKEARKSVLMTLGQLSFEQLSDLRHRGAFSTVAQTFAEICRLCSVSEENEMNDYLEIWYRQTLALIESRDIINTRRSAGIPSIMVALLSAAENKNLLYRFIADMTRISNLPASQDYETIEALPQVHALNSLRAAFMTTALAEQTRQYNVEVLAMATKSLTNTIWAIRNSGLMLFRILVERLLRSNENLNSSLRKSDMKTMMSMEEYPGLVDLTLRLLRSATSAKPNESLAEEEKTNTELIFPVLSLLQKLTPPASQFEEIRALVLKLTGSDEWHVRDIAAQTLASSLAHQKFRKQIELILLNGAQMVPNQLHGRLLSIEYFLSMRQAAREIIDLDIINAVVDLQLTLSKISSTVGNSIIVAKGVDIVNAIGRWIATTTLPKGSRASTYQIFQQTSEHSQSQSKKFVRAADFSSALLDESILVNEFLISIIGLQVDNGEIQKSSLKRITDAFRNGEARGLYRATQFLLPLLNHLDDTNLRSIAEVLCLELSNDHHSQTRLLVAETTLDGIMRIMHDRSLDMSTPILDRALGRLQFSHQVLDSRSPSASNNCIRIWAESIASQRRMKGDWTQDLETELDQFIIFVKQLMDVEIEFPTRFAAASSLNAIIRWWHLEPLPSASFQLKIWLILYNTLLDDDDEIRQIGSAIYSKLKPICHQEFVSTRSVAPSRAAESLLAELIPLFKNTICLGREGISHLLGTDAENLQPFAKTFDSAISDNNALFAKEKQNLYIDEVEEATKWSALLQKAGINCITESLRNTVQVWALDGLSHLAKHLDHARDGALGWTSKPEVYSKGWQLICVTDLALRWANQSPSGIFDASSVRAKLHAIVAAGKRYSLHELWIEKILLILQQDA